MIYAIQLPLSQKCSRHGPSQIRADDALDCETMQIEIITHSHRLKAEITADENPQTAQSIIDILPITGTTNRWGDEIYFSTSLKIPAENGVSLMKVGDLAYWPSGQMICLFFGPTPASTNDQPRAACNVSRFGRIVDDSSVLRKVTGGTTIQLRKLD